MSSAIVLVQSEAVHLACDAAEYNGTTGILDAVNATKCLAIPTLHAAISTTGPSENAAIFASRLPELCDSFDDLVAKAEEVVPELFLEAAELHRSDKASGKLWLIGWSQHIGRPAAYCMPMWTDGYNPHNNDPARRFKLKQYSFCLEPPVPLESLGDNGFVLQDDNERVVPELDLLHLMEVQRHTPYRDGRFWIGGKCLLTTITHQGISQRVVHHWAEDQVGDVIRPGPIDWRAWRAEREKQLSATIIPAGVSRLKREMMEKKLRKNTLRVA